MNKQQIYEKAILTIKYIILAIIIGVVVGIVDTVFGRGLIAISDFRTANYKYLIPFLPVAGLLITWLYLRFSKLSLKGMTLVFEVGQEKRDSIPLALVPLVMVGTWITHLFGGSAGREGVAVQIGATLSHYLGRKMKTPDNSNVRYGSRFWWLVSNSVGGDFFCHGSNCCRLYGLSGIATCNNRSLCSFIYITLTRT